MNKWISVLLVVACVQSQAKTTRMDELNSRFIDTDSIDVNNTLSIDGTEIKQVLDGDGIGISGSELKVIVDNQSLEINSDTIGVKNNGIGSNEMGDNSVGSAEITDGEILWDDLATSTQNTINVAGGGTVTNNVDDVSTKENGSSQIYIYNTYGAGYDTLTASATPSIATSMCFKVLTADTLTNFTGNPGAGIPKRVTLSILCSNFRVQEGNILTGLSTGDYLAPDSLDILEVFWDGQSYNCYFPLGGIK